MLEFLPIDCDELVMDRWFTDVAIMECWSVDIRRDRVVILVLRSEEEVVVLSVLGWCGVSYTDFKYSVIIRRCGFRKKNFEHV